MSSKKIGFSLNAIGQLLLPLVGIKRKKLEYFRDCILDIRLHDNKVAITSNEKLLLNKEHEKGTKYLYLLEPLKGYKDDYNKLLNGDYFGVREMTKRMLLRTLKGNYKFWEGIFYNTDKTIKEVLKNKIGDVPFKEDTLDNLFELVIQKRWNFRAYPPLNELNKEMYDRNQIRIEFEYKE